MRILSDLIIDRILEKLGNKELVILAIIDDDSFDFFKSRINNNQKFRNRVKLYLETPHQFSYIINYKPDCYTMRSCTDLTKIKIPDYIISIGYNCFSRCPNLEQVIFPKYINQIGSWSFYNCPKLKNLIFPDKIIFTGCFTFWKSEGVQNIVRNNKNLREM